MKVYKYRRFLTEFQWQTPGGNILRIDKGVTQSEFFNVLLNMGNSESYMLAHNINNTMAARQEKKVK